MKKLAACTGILLVFFGVMVHAQHEMRTWTARSGARVRAALVETKGAAVVLRKEDGALVTIDLSQIIAADREYAMARRPAASTGPTDGTVTFVVETKSTGKQFAPRHVLAIWVTDGKGGFVRTLECSAKPYIRYLKRWGRESGGNVVDAVTGASLKTHRSHAVTWNCRDAAGNLVADGLYRFHVEFSEVNGPGPSTPREHIKFVKGPKPYSANPKPLPNFANMSLAYKPASP